MKKFKRMIALITVAMFLLSIAAPSAFAATKEDAFGRLNALGVAYGDQNGNPMYDKSFTRAEAAAIMVNLLGMKAAIDSAKGATKFKDVPASHWASGVINLSVGAGVIKGYPDGSYKPDKEVTYAEMSALLVQVLGYAPQLQGTWPSNVIGKAAQLGLLDGVSVTDVNAAAVRYNVFLAADKATTVKPLIETKNGYEEATTTLMEKRLNVAKKAEGTVIATPFYGADKNKVKIDPTPLSAGSGDEYTVTVGSGVDANAIFGLKVVPWVKDDKVFFFDVKTDKSDILIDTAKGAGTGTAVTLKDKDKTYDFETTVIGVSYAATIKRNLADAAGSNIADGDQLKVVLNANGKVQYLEAFKYDTAMVKEVKSTDEKLIFEISGSLDLKDDTRSIVKAGKEIALADIKVGDIVSYVTTGAISKVVVSDATAKGTLTAAAIDGSKYVLTIDGKAVKTLSTIYTSTDSGKTFTAVSSADSFKSLFGKAVTAKLDKDGKAAYVIADSAAAANEFTALVKEISRPSGNIENKTYLKIAKFDGTNTYYEATKDTKLNDNKINETALKDNSNPRIEKDGDVNTNVVAGEIVKVALTSDGKVDYIKEYSTELANAQPTVSNKGITVDKTNDTLNVGADTQAYTINSDTKIIKVKTYVADAVYVRTASNDAINEAEATFWSAVEALGTNAEAVGTVVKDGGIAKYVVIYNENGTNTSAGGNQLNLTSNFYYGMVMAVGTDATGDWTKFTIEGAEKTYYGNKAATTKKLAKFKLNGEGKIDSTPSQLVAETISDGTYSDSYGVVKSVDKTNNLIELRVSNSSGVEANADTTKVVWVKINSKTSYFKQIDTTDPVKLIIDDITKGDVVQIFDDFDKDGLDAPTGDGVIDFVVKVK